jgi:hypothetical protein
MIANVIMIIRLRNKLGTTTETIRIVLFSSIGDFMMISDTIDLLLLSMTDDILYWEETVLFSLLLVDMTTVELSDELENMAMLVESVCTEVKVDFIPNFVLLDSDGKQGTLARNKAKQIYEQTVLTNHTHK